MAVLFASSRPLERAENIKAVYDAYDGDKYFTVLNLGRKSVDISSGYYDLLVSDEFPAESCEKMILIGHGICGGKLVGLDQPKPFYKPEEATFLDYVVSTSIDTIPLVAKQSGVSKSKVLPLGMPRTDAYFGKQKGDGKTFLANKRAYLYAPTYRGKHDTPFPDVDWKKIDGMLTDDEIFAVKPHMISENILNGDYKHIVQIFGSRPSTPYLIDCDVLITDYSTIMFDAQILNKPVVLFDKNTDYLSTRGMYFPYPDFYSSRHCTSEEELVYLSRSAKHLNKTDIDCRNFVASACDGHSTERVIDLIRRLQ